MSRAVLPFGSRLSTSRIDFRLLSREAAVNGRRLAVIAPDGATRALCGIGRAPVVRFGGEYEQSLETSDGIAGDASGGGGASAGGAGLAAAAGATTEGDVAADVRSGSSTATSAAGTASAAVADGSGQAAGRPAPTTATTGAGAVPPAAAPSAGATSASAAAATLPGTRSGTSTERLKPLSTHPEAKRPATGSSGRLAGRGVLAGIGSSSCAPRRRRGGVRVPARRR